MKTILLSILLATPLLADTNTIPILTVGDRTFTNATVRKVNPTTAIVRDDAGFGSIAITNLPEPFRSRFFDANEIAAAENLARHSREVESAMLRAAVYDQRKKEGVEINGQWVSKRLLQEVRVRVDSVNAESINGTCVRVIRFFTEAQQLNELQRSGLDTIGAYRGYTPSPAGEKREYGQSVVIRHGPRDASIGKEIVIKAKQLGVENGFEIWDCGTVPTH